NTLVGGRGSGAATAAGVAAGLAIWTVAASAGLGALLAASEPAFLALRLAGGAYLVWLGANALRSASRGGPPGAPPPAPLRPRGGRPEPRVSRAPGRAQQPRQPEDRRLLHEPAAAVRELVRGPAGSRPHLLRDDVAVADALRARRRAGPRLPPPPARTAGDG